MEWDFLKALGWMILALAGLWFSLGNPLRDIKSFIDLWRGN